MPVVDRRVDRANTTKPELRRTYSEIDNVLYEMRLYPKTHGSLSMEITACSTTLFALAPARRRKVCMYPTVRVPRLCEGYPSSCVGLVGWLDSCVATPRSFARASPRRRSRVGVSVRYRARVP